MSDIPDNTSENSNDVSTKTPGRLNLTHPSMEHNTQNNDNNNNNE